MREVAIIVSDAYAVSGDDDIHQGDGLGCKNPSAGRREPIPGGCERDYGAMAESGLRPFPLARQKAWFLPGLSRTLRRWAFAAQALTDDEVPLPALARLSRFGRRQAVGDWRAWLAGWLGRSDLAGVPPAVIAAAAPEVAGETAGSVWWATPVHLQAGLRSVHLPWQGLLRLDAAEVDVLARDFDASFAVSGFRLRVVAGGELLAYGPRFESWPVTTDPARLWGADIAGFTPQGDGAAALLRLGAELEMWLHAHPLNVARSQARRPAISTLWLWGGGVPGTSRSDVSAAGGAVLGADAFAAGLGALTGARCLSGVDADAARVLEIGEGLERVAVIVTLFGPDASGAMSGLPAPTTSHEALKRLDERLLAPLQAVLGRDGFERLHLVANGHVTRLAVRDGLRFWRRPRPAWTVLQ